MPRGVYDRSKMSNKRDQILDAATRIYGFYGFEGATIERMAAAAGVSKALVIEYFGSKQEIVKAIASRAVSRNLEKIRYIDGQAGLTLRQRERMIFDILKPAREEWCLILGTMLVPNFQFQMREEMERYLHYTEAAVAGHLEEFRCPGPQIAHAFAYSSISLHMGYILGGREQDYQVACKHLLELYLRPEQPADSSPEK